MSVIMAGQPFGNTGPIVAEFFLAEHDQWIYTYEAVQRGELWQVGLNRWGVEDRTEIPVNANPTLLNMTFDLATRVVNGSCTYLPTPNSATNFTISCMQGTFTNMIVPVNVTSSVPVVTNSGPDLPGNTTSLLFSKADEDVWPHGEPYMRIRLDSLSSREVIRTAGQDPFNCRRLRVCVNGVQRSGRTDLVGAEVMAPLALLFIHHAQYATTCGGRSPTTTFPR